MLEAPILDEPPVAVEVRPVELEAQPVLDESLTAAAIGLRELIEQGTATIVRGED